MHVSDETLILHRYGETTPDDARQIARHLAACRRCRETWDALSDLGARLDDAPVPEPDRAFEDRTWTAVIAAIGPASPVRATGAGRVRAWMPAAAVAAGIGTLVVGAATLRPPVIELPQVATHDAPGPGPRQRVLYTAFNEHLDQAEMLLVELRNAAEASAEALAFERVAADDLVSTGRLYRVTAEQQGEWRIARMLDALEPVLVEVARTPASGSLRHVEDLQARIDDSSLLFEVRALRTSLRSTQYSVGNLQ